jgi:hypothetical protein
VRKLIVDTGFLVALYVQRDTLHSFALAYLKANRRPLQTVLPVIVEACFFLDPNGKFELLKWIGKGGVEVIDMPIESYEEIAGYSGFLFKELLCFTYEIIQVIVF